MVPIKIVGPLMRLTFCNFLGQMSVLVRSAAFSLSLSLFST